MLYDSARERRLEEGLDFMIKHVDDSRPAWPRLIAAGRRWNIVAPSKQHALARFKAANLMDCRISAYNIDEKNKKARKMAPSVLQIDEDKEYFVTTGEFELTASKTNINFKERLDGHPTQIWTGNGYHWIQPQLAIILEEPPMFKKFKEPSRRFLHFEEQLLSGGKADPNHSRNTSFGNMWLRVPGSLNSN